MDNEPVHRVTITDLYRQGEDIRSSLSAMHSQTAVLIDRGETRDEQIDKMEVRVSRLEKVVYWAGIPLAAIAGGSLGWDWIKGII